MRKYKIKTIIKDGKTEYKPMVRRWFIWHRLTWFPCPYREMAERIIESDKLIQLENTFKSI